MQKILAFILCLFPMWQAAAQNAGIGTRTLALDNLIAQQTPTGSHVGVAVYDLTTGQSVYRYQADKLCRPASTMKVLTAITALADAPQPFATQLYGQGVVANDTLQGDLYVVGGFDPELDDAEIDEFVEAVAQKGIRHIRGKVYGDISAKDSLYWGKGWLWDDNPADYQPYMSPLMYHKGVVSVTVSPSAPGAPAQVKVEPASSYYTLHNLTASKSPKAGKLVLTRNWLDKGNHLILSGNVSNPHTESINVEYSYLYFLHVLVERLAARSIGCEGYDVRTLAPGAWPIHTCQTPFQTVLNNMLKESDNLNAEAVLWKIGAATGKKHVRAEDGLKKMRALISGMGLNPKAYRVADGCGLSMYDYVSPDLLVAFLQYAYQNPRIYESLMEALPVGGVDGTLKHRMKSAALMGKVHAKTGTYTGISCLAGYLETSNHHILAFAIMNQNILSARLARTMQDNICETLAANK